jgi:hypothetical protein
MQENNTQNMLIFRHIKHKKAGQKYCTGHLKYKLNLKSTQKNFRHITKLMNRN